MFEEWAQLQREACEAQIALVEDLFERQRRRLEELLPAEGLPQGQAVKPKGDRPPAHDEPPFAEAAAAAAVDPPPPPRPPPSPPPRGSRPRAEEVAAAVTPHWPRGDAVEQLYNGFEILDWWKQCSGMHTVEQWASNYTKHPAGWGALLMIHGVAEVSGRLRSKVENFAIYSALFLSVSLTLVGAPPDRIKECGKDDRLHCEIRRRIYFYALVVGMAAHMLSILLAMSFVNVLNEAARDSDVIRMFARGQGFRATFKCQRAFIVGSWATLLAIAATLDAFLGWEILALGLATVTVVYVLYKRTACRLERSASIVRYWRKELGGRPDEDDPYELALPLELLRRRAADARAMQAAVAENSDAAAADKTTASEKSIADDKVPELRDVNIETASVDKASV